MNLQNSFILLFGAGYVASHLASALKREGAKVALTTRDPQKAEKLRRFGFDVVVWGDDLPAGVTHALSLIPPDKSRHDPILDAYKSWLLGEWGTHLQWFGYISTTGVYGEHYGNYVTEESDVNPQTDRARTRLKIERQFLSMSIPVHIFRVSGIYGPGRGILERVRLGKLTNLPIDKQPINRIHVADIVNIILASMHKPTPGEIFNVSDDLPAPTIDTIRFAGSVLGKDKFINSLPNAAPKPKGGMGEGFRMVNNTKVKRELEVKLQYPTFKEGFKALAGKA